MELLTKELEEKLPAFLEQDGLGGDAVVYAIFESFTWTWYVLEYNPKNQMFFGIVDGIEQEYGYFSLHQLYDLVLSGIPVLLRKNFEPTTVKELNLLWKTTI